MSDRLKPSRGVVTHTSPRPPAARLFCCSFAGGSAGAWAPWRDRLPDDIELCAFELPGRAGRFREAPLRSMADVVDHIEELLQGRLDLRFALYGHSMGAVTALEVARRLVAKGEPPAALLVSGCAAPHLPSKRERPLHLLPRPELIGELIRLEGLPAVALARPDFLDTFLPTIRADMECRERWVSEIADIGIPIHVLGGTADKMVTGEDLAAWRHYTTARFVVKRFAGGHFFIDTAMGEVVRYIAEAITAPGEARPAADRRATL